MTCIPGGRLLFTTNGVFRVHSSSPSDSLTFLPVPTSTTSSTNSTFRLPLLFKISSSAISGAALGAGFFRFTRFERSLAPFDASSSFSRCAAGDWPRIEPRIPPNCSALSALPLAAMPVSETGDWRSSTSCFVVRSLYFHWIYGGRVDLHAVPCLEPCPSHHQYLAVKQDPSLLIR